MVTWDTKKHNLLIIYMYEKCLYFKMSGKYPQLDLGSSAARRGSSSLPFRTKYRVSRASQKTARPQSVIYQDEARFGRISLCGRIPPQDGRRICWPSP